MWFTNVDEYWDCSYFFSFPKIASFWSQRDNTDEVALHVADPGSIPHSEVLSSTRCDLRFKNKFKTYSFPSSFWMHQGSLSRWFQDASHKVGQFIKMFHVDQCCWGLCPLLHLPSCYLHLFPASSLLSSLFSFFLSYSYHLLLKNLKVNINEGKKERRGKEDYKLDLRSVLFIPLVKCHLLRSLKDSLWNFSF